MAADRTGGVAAARPVRLAQVGVPPLEVAEHRPTISAAEFAGRMASLRQRVETTTVVYGDREHFANLAYFCGFDPRFEEALLVLSGSSASLLVGNEGEVYARIVPSDVEVVLCPALSLMGQDRTKGVQLDEALRVAGVEHGGTVGVVGWKSLEAEEWVGDAPAIVAPAFVIDLLRHLVGPGGEVFDATPVVMNPVDGLRATNSADQIAAFEWAAARASRCIARIVMGTRPGMSELETVSTMGYAGEPLSTHIMFSSGPEIVVGLRSATARRIELGDAATAAVGFWGGLCCRAGLVATADALPGSHEADFLDLMAVPYWRAIATWWETLRIGTSGGEIDAAVRESLEGTGIGPALNPGHLTHLDEWVHSPIRPGATDRIVSGMAFQCDIIPDNTRERWAANCEDGVAVADATLRAELELRHPEVWGRIAARARFVREHLGVAIGEEILPLSAIPAYYPPFWLSPDMALVAG